MHLNNLFFGFQNIETRVFSPTTYTVGEQRPKISEAPRSHRKRKGSENVSGPNPASKVGRGKRNGV